jgi:hypothetical protein
MAREGRVLMRTGKGAGKVSGRAANITGAAASRIGWSEEHSITHGD